MSMPVPISDRETRRLRRLVASVRDAVLTLRDNLAALGIQIHIGQTSRTKKQQLANLKAGRAATVRSWHRVNRAVDIYLVDPDTGKLDMKVKRVDLYKIMHREAEKLGFRVLGTGILHTASGKPFRDPYHIEMRNGLTWAQAWRQSKKNA